MKTEISRYSTAARYLAVIPLMIFGLLSILATGEVGDGGGAPPPATPSQLAFRADDGKTGGELWKTDGTDAGTAMVKDINPGGDSSPSELTVFNDMVYFRASDGTGMGMHGSELWKSDGTEAGTELVKDINSGTNGSDPSELTVSNGWLYFYASDPTNGRELWKSDGVPVAAGGTTEVLDINPGSGNSIPTPNEFTVFNGAVYFTANDNTGKGQELWKSDGTDPGVGTVMVADINPGGDSNPTDFAVFNGALYFRARDNTHGFELWKSDGVPVAAGGTTERVTDIIVGSTNSVPAGQKFTVFNGWLYFRANDGTNFEELWRSDGTPGGTTELVADINPAGSSTPSELTVFNGALYFRANDGNGEELWKSDGVPVAAGGTTEMVANINIGGGSSPSELTVFNGALYFRANDGVSGPELWKSDGTAAGTVQVKDINMGAGGSSPSDLTVSDATLYFRANDGVNGPELWKSDGTAAGTVQVKDINMGAGGSSPVGFTVF
jgi:ELWxxDGT repeat protein